MTDQDFGTLCNRAEDYLRAYRSRRMAQDASSTRSTLGEQLDILAGLTPASVMGHAYDSAAQLSDAQCWCLTIGCILAHLGRLRSYVLLARLTRRPKSPEQSWREIGIETHLRMADVKSEFRTAVIEFCRAIDDRGVAISFRKAAA